MASEAPPASVAPAVAAPGFGADFCSSRRRRSRIRRTGKETLLRQRKELREQMAVVQPPPAAESRPAAPAIDPRDPEPTYESFVAANPNHADPYAGYLRAQAAWDRRQEAKQEHAARQRVAEEQSVSQAISTYQGRAQVMREQFSDFDAVTDPFIAQYAQHPSSPAIAAFVASDALGPQVLYHLATHPDAVKDVLAPGVNPLVALGEVKATVRAAMAPKPVPTSQAPAPPSVTVGSGAQPTDESARSLKEHVRLREREDRERRAR